MAPDVVTVIGAGGSRTGSKGVAQVHEPGAPSSRRRGHPGRRDQPVEGRTDGLITEWATLPGHEQMGIVQRACTPFIPVSRQGCHRRLMPGDQATRAEFRGAHHQTIRRHVLEPQREGRGEPQPCDGQPRPQGKREGVGRWRCPQNTCVGGRSWRASAA